MPLAALFIFLSLWTNTITFEDSSLLGREDTLLNYRFPTLRRDVVPSFLMIYKFENISMTCISFNMKMARFVKTPGTEYPVTQRHTSEQESSTTVCVKL
jgi:hypothetical protein